MHDRMSMGLEPTGRTPNAPTPQRLTEAEVRAGLAQVIADVAKRRAG